MRIFHVLDKIENAIYNSRKIPLLKNYALIRQDKILNLIEKTRQSLPEEMKQARWMSKENQRIMQDSQSKAGEIIREAERRAAELIRAAKEESRKLLDKELIVVNAKNLADEIQAEAKKESDAMINDARLKSGEMLKNAEIRSADMLRKSRDEADITRKGSDDYAMRVLSTMENEFSRILSVIKKSKETLQPAQKTREIPEQALEAARAGVLPTKPDTATKQQQRK